MQSLKWPRILFFGFWIYIAFQMLPLPKFLTRILSPGAFNFRQLYAPNFSSATFFSVSLVPSQTLKAALALLSYFLMGYLIFKIIKRRSQIVRVFYVIFMMGVFEAFYGMLQYYGFSTRFISGTFVSRNHFAGYLEMIIPIGLALIFIRMDLLSFTRLSWKEKLIKLAEKKTAISLLMLLGVILMSLALVFSRSRSAAVLLIFIYIFFFFLSLISVRKNKEHEKKIRIVLVSVFIIIFCFSFYVGMDTTFERFSMERLAKESRLGIWENSLKLLAGYPVLGTGLGTFAALFPNMEGDGKLAKISHAHNDYLEYLIETGVIGFGLLFGGILIIFWACFKFWIRKRHPVMQGLGMGGLVAIAAILIHSITDFNLHIQCNMMLFAVILSLTLVSVTYKPSDNTK
jgi:O-antigen ligase